MQEILADNPQLLKDLKSSISEPRLNRYVNMSNGDEEKAILLYQWNSQLSQSLYIYLQGWEVCLRNKLNFFLIWKYGKNRPYDQDRFVRQLTREDKKRLSKSIKRQEADRNLSPAPTSAIVAELTAGFWVSLLSKSYDVPYSWRYNLGRIFPNDKALDRPAAWEACDRLLVLRNRIAHHEPILHLPLEQRHVEFQRIVAAMCTGSHALCEETCNFRSVWSRRP